MLLAVEKDWRAFLYADTLIRSDRDVMNTAVNKYRARDLRVQSVTDEEIRNMEKIIQVMMTLENTPLCNIQLGFVI
jgi:hypothetical protein